MPYIHPETPLCAPSPPQSPEQADCCRGSQTKDSPSTHPPPTLKQDIAVSEEEQAGERLADLTSLAGQSTRLQAEQAAEQARPASGEQSRPVSARSATGSPEP